MAHSSTPHHHSASSICSISHEPATQDTSRADASSDATPKHPRSPSPDRMPRQPSKQSSRPKPPLTMLGRNAMVRNPRSGIHYTARDTLLIMKTNIEIAERLLIYHAGTGRITFLAMVKVTTLFLGAFFTFIVVPGYVKAEKSKWEIMGSEFVRFVQFSRTYCLSSYELVGRLWGTLCESGVQFKLSASSISKGDEACRRYHHHGLSSMRLRLPLAGQSLTTIVSNTAYLSLRLIFPLLSPVDLDNNS